jgi:DNA-binding transcriptional ArsR family regulator
MDKEIATQIFESLSSGIRLDIYRLLVKEGPVGIVSGQIAQILGLPANNISFHLKAMTQSGLLTVVQEGRFQRYRANIPVMVDLISYLTEECCSGNPHECAPFQQDSVGSSSVSSPFCLGMSPGKDHS